MGVYIPNMEIPKDCKSCPFCHQTIYCRALKRIGDYSYFRDGKMADCPLQFVPTPHGDLIDQEALVRRIDDFYAACESTHHRPNFEDSLGRFDFEQAVAPIVIEAED